MKKKWKICIYIRFFFTFLPLFPFFRNATTMSSTVPSAGFMGSWVEVEMVDRWRRSCCRSTVRAEQRMAPSWSETVRRLWETTLCPSGQWQWSLFRAVEFLLPFHVKPLSSFGHQAVWSSPALQDPLTSGVWLHTFLPDRQPGVWQSLPPHLSLQRHTAAM